ncbi:MAG: hypothetical protein Ct9H300mP28_14300 [Pseudomonadota bacterium]|nr:MAG: hypothetical protein Ct9H300mP28_14300 [Pseudomonadota bacterium]
MHLWQVPEEEYEAAKVDGAGMWLQFKSNTFPNLFPTLTVLGLVGTLWASNVFDIIWMMTRGGPGVSTTTVRCSCTTPHSRIQHFKSFSRSNHFSFTSDNLRNCFYLFKSKTIHPCQRNL